MTLSYRACLFSFIGILFLLPSTVQAATLNLSPINTTIGIGATFTETVFVSSTDQAINAISGAISFPPELLQVVSISKTNSVLSLWVQDPIFSNTDGTISFSGIVPNPGYTGGRGTAITIQFRAKREGTAAVVFSASSQVLANDGNGTDILSDTSAASVTVTAGTPAPAQAPATSAPTTSTDLLAHITSSTHPDQTQWYNLPHAVFDWTNAQGVSAVRLGYDKNGDGKPSVLYTDLISHKELDLGNGISYFHVQERGSIGWGPISSYRVQIDTVSPRTFAITFPQGTTTQPGTPIPALFTTTDDLSGIDHYQIAVDGKEFKITADEGSKPYVISANPGAHMLLVRAYDKAGNSSLANERFSVTEVAQPVQPSPFDFFTFGWLAINYVSIFFIALAILITLLFGAWYVRAHFMAYRRRLNHELGLTHAHIHKEFDILKEAIAEEILTIEQEKSRRDLTRTEEKIVARFKKLLDRAEQTIEKDIEELPR